MHFFIIQRYDTNETSQRFIGYPSVHLHLKAMKEYTK